MKTVANQTFKNWQELPAFEPLDLAQQRFGGQQPSAAFDPPRRTERQRAAVLHDLAAARPVSAKADHRSTLSEQPEL